MSLTSLVSASYASTDNDRAQLAERIDVRGCIDAAFARDLDLGEMRAIADEPVMLRIEKAQGVGLPDFSDECEALRENERLQDLGSFWAIESDDLGDALAADIEARAPYWIGTHRDNGECAVDWSRDDDDLEDDLIGALRRFISDWVSILDYASDVRDLPGDVRDDFCGAHCWVTFRIIANCGDYITTLNSLEFDELDAARDFAAEKLGEWLSDESLDFAAVMLATNDRSGLCTINLPRECEVSLDDVFDKWVHLA